VEQPRAANFGVYTRIRRIVCERTRRPCFG
jgi:hypothetical protein